MQIIIAPIIAMVASVLAPLGIRPDTTVEEAITILLTGASVYVYMLITKK